MGLRGQVTVSGDGRTLQDSVEELDVYAVSAKGGVDVDSVEFDVAHEQMTQQGIFISIEVAAWVNCLFVCHGASGDEDSLQCDLHSVI
jgi:hypothetical protein